MLPIVISSQYVLCSFSISQSQKSAGIVSFLIEILSRYCMFIPDESANVSPLLNHLRTQMGTLSDVTPSPGDLINQ